MAITQDKAMEYLTWFSLVMTGTFMYLKWVKAATALDYDYYSMMAMLWLIFAFVVHSYKKHENKTRG